MTLAEMILAAHSGKTRVTPGEFIEVNVDMVLSNDITGPIAIREFKKIGVNRVFNPKKVVMVPDHFTPNKDIASAEQAKQVREFCKEQGCHYFEVGRVGIEHVLLHEEGLVLPGEVIIGADSHTCTYGALGAFGTGMGSTDIASAMATGHIWMKVPSTIRFNYYGNPRRWVGGKDFILHAIGDIGVDGALYAAMEFGGEAIDWLSLEGRLTMANMAIEAGGKAGLFYADEKTVSYIKERTNRPFTVYNPNPDAQYEKVIDYDVSDIEPQVAFPHLPSNTRPVSQAGHIKIDQAVIGSCTNGRIEDLRVAAQVLKGRQVASSLRCIIIPGSQSVYMQALKEGLIETFIAAGCAVSAPTCGPCLGGHMGILASGEKAIATTNRNFVGRMGSPKSEVYLSSPAVAAASAISGNIINPDDLA
ncbi:MAG: 3-isopropylmalate dehydratase large subunit [Dehalococcoidales bacterium]|jgi:3-isopropylmalate/(R)-2-methylmalate dehydratase large subunit|nr:3-isopropylmalate dehydratase large subunit [Dehalococcoidales bacterium]MDD3264704.1 3-isopropylmalate dehydratase large subunit [Dehalococcoidales bacterium]MDD4322315.1 3-isopropylmalate dehydratase large subunit [Dehalococcoidales bacterium]MDD4793943.1 3-isopropylmalate dehydratase large subunit [Dehalococcoidales bacterium]MDD5122283.1 3-isopropylmalate dehydratase large subunit [Dehalococcoidales bacterium]